ncbi:hypothetical protein [Fictibacillus sp. FJAT-27399]
MNTFLKRDADAAGSLTKQMMEDSLRLWKTGG